MQVVRISDGFQPHLVSPELGLRKLVQESIEMVLDPVATAVRRVHQVLLEVARSVSYLLGLHKFITCGSCCTLCLHVLWSFQALQPSLEGYILIHKPPCRDDTSLFPTMQDDL